MRYTAAELRISWYTVVLTQSLDTAGQTSKIDRQLKNKGTACWKRHEGGTAACRKRADDALPLHGSGVKCFSPLRLVRCTQCRYIRLTSCLKDLLVVVCRVHWYVGTISGCSRILILTPSYTSPLLQISHFGCKAFGRSSSASARSKAESMPIDTRRPFHVQLGGSEGIWLRECDVVHVMCDVLVGNARPQVELPHSHDAFADTGPALQHINQHQSLPGEPSLMLGVRRSAL